MERPNTIDPVEWALWNQRVAQTLRDCLKLPESEIRPDPKPYRIEVTDMPPEVRALTLVMRNAASELHGTSEKGDRIALQLLTALAKFAQETGT